MEAVYMKLSLVIGTLALAAVALPGVAMAQAKPDTFTHTMTGCLKKTQDANIFSFTDENGKMWELQSKTVQLAPHVNHTVTITGKLPQKPNPNGNGSSPDAAPDNRFRVTSLKMVSESCGQSQ
jgi:hypothetical protein